MPDPFRIFKDTPGKHNTLKILWPELYAALAGDGEPAPGEAGPPPKPATPCCALHCAAGTDPKVKRPISVARLSQYGPPACATCVNTYADRPGGWPLDFREERRREKGSRGY